MLRRAVPLFAVLGCLAVAPLAAQQSQAASTTPARQEQQLNGGPRVTPEYQSYQPAIAGQNSLATAAADRVTITITTLGLILLIVLLVLLIA